MKEIVNGEIKFMTYLKSISFSILYVISELIIYFDDGSTRHNMGEEQSFKSTSLFMFRSRKYKYVILNGFFYLSTTFNR
jgi:hypothetical protein